MQRQNEMNDRMRQVSITEANPLNVYSILQSGGEYKPWHVYRLKRMLEKATTLPFRFFCFSDHYFNDKNIDTYPLAGPGPGWWHQIQVFDVHSAGQGIYFDLDITFLNNIDDILSFNSSLAFRGSFSQPERHITSSTIIFNERGAEYVREKWKQYGSKVKIYRALRPCRGVLGQSIGLITREFFEPFCPHHERLEVHFPGRIVRDKEYHTGQIPDEASIVCYGRFIRPWHYQEGVNL